MVAEANQWKTVVVPNPAPADLSHKAKPDPSNHVAICCYSSMLYAKAGVRKGREGGCLLYCLLVSV